MKFIKFFVYIAYLSSLCSLTAMEVGLNVPLYSKKTQMKLKLYEMVFRQKQEEFDFSGINEKDFYGQTVFSLALIMGKDNDFLSFLLERGADISKEFDHISPVLAALRTGNSNLLGVLLSHKAPLPHGRRGPHFPIIFLMNQLYAELDQNIPEEKDIIKKYTECASLIIDAGCPLNTEPTTDSSLECAMRHGFTSFANLFLQKGADPARKYVQRSALEYAQLIKKEKAPLDHTEKKLYQQRKVCANMVLRWRQKKDKLKALEILLQQLRKTPTSYCSFLPFELIGQLRYYININLGLLPLMKKEKNNLIYNK